MEEDSLGRSRPFGPKQAGPARDAEPARSVPPGGRIGPRTRRGFWILGATYALSLLIAWAALTRVEADIEEIAGHAEVMSATAYEMEINVIGSGMAAMKYLHRPDPAFIARFQDDEGDIQRVFDDMAAKLQDVTGDLEDQVRARTRELAESNAHLLEELERLAATIPVRLVNNASTRLPMLRADPMRLQQILLNLVSNAVKFTEADGCVTVDAVVRADTGIAITIGDTGIGMRPQDIPKALTPFEQIDGSLARKYAGTGLGLPLVKMFVELHGGELAIESVRGIGTVVTVAFPPERTLSGPVAAAAG